MNSIATDKRPPRYSLLTQVQVNRQSEVYILSTLNISTSGVFLLGTPQEYPELKVGIEVELQIFDPDEPESDEVNLNARVVRIVKVPSRLESEPGFGLQFSRLNAQKTTMLDRLIKRNLAPTAQADKAPPPAPKSTTSRALP